jgi:hypothetical protein
VKQHVIPTKAFLADTRETELSTSRDNAWVAVAHSKHFILQVFTSDAAHRDLVILGSVNLDFKNGKSLVSPFASHVIIDKSSDEAGSPRLSFMQLFAVRLFLENHVKLQFVLTISVPIKNTAPIQTILQTS